MRSARDAQRGFSLLAIILLLALMAAAVALALDDAASTIQTGGRMRANEALKASVEEGINQGLVALQETAPGVARDPVELIDPTNIDRWDIFRPGPGNTPDMANDLIPGGIYFPTGNAGTSEYTVRVGLGLGQVTRGLEGEDVRSGFGQVMELQIVAAPNLAVNPALPPLEERVSVGVLVPRRAAHQNY